jgi:hypothetical protein
MLDYSEHPALQIMHMFSSCACYCCRAVTMRLLLLLVLLYPACMFMQAPQGQCSWVAGSGCTPHQTGPSMATQPRWGGMQEGQA